MWPEASVLWTIEISVSQSRAGRRAVRRAGPMAPDKLGEFFELVAAQAVVFVVVEVIE
jgi:hypothetical protein